MIFHHCRSPFPTYLKTEKGRAGFLPDSRVIFPLYTYWPRKHDFGKVAVNKVENIFAGAQKSPVELNPTGQNDYYCILLLCIVHADERKTP